MPMVLINGADGIGTGYSTYVPQFNPMDIIDNIKKLLDNDDINDMKPW
jgi:DNA topoisomerase-2